MLNREKCSTLQHFLEAKHNRTDPFAFQVWILIVHFSWFDHIAHMSLHTCRVDVCVVAWSMHSPALQSLRPCCSTSACVLTCPAPKNTRRRKGLKSQIKVSVGTCCSAGSTCPAKIYRERWLIRTCGARFCCMLFSHSVPVQAEHRTFLLEHFCC